MKKIIVNENQRGFLFKNGRYIKMLTPGKYILTSSMETEIVNMDTSITLRKCSLDTILADKQVAQCVDTIEVSDRQIALHYVNGVFNSVLKSGKYAYFKVFDKHEFTPVDIEDPLMNGIIPEHIFSRISNIYFMRVEIKEYEKGRLYYNNKFIKILDAGTYYFWKNGTKIDVGVVDTRLTQLNIAGQEILTHDKVAIRVNFVLNYRVTDCVKILTEIDDFTEQLHVAAQLALREFVCNHKLDEILEMRDELSSYVFKSLKSREKDLFVEITQAGVKDIILPGEVRAIMNTVLIAEKRAQASVITRREEVASTRS
ncbi:MAG: slipin family protein, partial [Ruminococcaceae bacterium]|nr:slipin family protein [Oscillospiraceae bacterium]